MITDRLNWISQNDVIVAYYLNEFYEYRIDLLDMLFTIIEKMAERHEKLIMEEVDQMMRKIENTVYIPMTFERMKELKEAINAN